MSENQDALVGTWKADLTEKAALNPYGKATLEFESDGTLRYTVHETNNDEVILLAYRLEPGFLITNQPSHPRLERTAYEIRPDGRLVLNFGGQKSLYYRVT